MRVRFTIDRVVVHGMDLSPLERVRFDDALRLAVESQVSGRLNAHGPAGLTSRQRDRERLDVPTIALAGGAGLGASVGGALAARVLAPASGKAGRR